MAADLKLQQGQKTSRDSRTKGGGDLCNIPYLRLPKPLGYGIIALTSLTCYMNSLDYDLVHDDVFAIKENSDVRPDTSLYNLFMNDFWGKPMWSNTSHKSYRPLCALTFRMNYMIHGLNPFGYHAVNIILHCMVSLLYTFMCDVVAFKSSVLAVFTGLLFTAHPVHTEAVSKRLSVLLIPLLCIINHLRHHSSLNVSCTKLKTYLGRPKWYQFDIWFKRWTLLDGSVHSHHVQWSTPAYQSK